MPTPWLFPSSRPGRHIVPHSITKRLRALGIDLLGARTTALQCLVAEVAPSLVAELLGYSYNVTQRHATTRRDCRPALGALCHRKECRGGDAPTAPVSRPNTEVYR
jgi:hypothetical protein